MHASIRRYIVVSGREEEAIRHAREGFLPLLRTVPGFVSYCFIDTGDGEMLGVSIYDSEEGALRANELARDYIQEHIPNTLNRTMVFDGSVVAYDGGKSA